MKIPFKFFFVTAVISCQQLLTDDKNASQSRDMKFGTHINYNVHIKILVEFFSHQLSSVVKSCQQLLTADKNEKRPREL